MRLAKWALKLKENYYKIILRYDMYTFMIKIYLRYLKIQHNIRTYNLETRTHCKPVTFYPNKNICNQSHSNIVKNNMLNNI